MPRMTLCVEPEMSTAMVELCRIAAIACPENSKGVIAIVFKRSKSKEPWYAQAGASADGKVVIRVWHGEIAVRSFRQTAFNCANLARLIGHELSHAEDFTLHKRRQQSRTCSSGHGAFAERKADRFEVATALNLLVSPVLNRHFWKVARRIWREGRITEQKR